MTRPGGGATAQRGVTLVELMVALVIGLVVSGVAIQIFISSKQAYRTTSALSRVQENGRYALDFLAADIRGAGFWGCAQDVELTNHIQDGAGVVDFSGPPLIGAENGTDPDSLTIRGAAQDVRRAVDKEMPNTAANLFLTTSDDLQEGDVLIVTDCEAADAFMITGNNKNNDNVQHNTGSSVNGLSNASKDFSRAYDASAVAYAARQRTYSVDTASHVLQRSVNGVTENLVSGVQDMEILYGVDTDSDQAINAYLGADDIPDLDADGNPDWDQVLSVRVELLLRSGEDNVLDTPQTYTFDEAAVTANDRRLRQVFTATVGVRNRLP